MIDSLYIGATGMHAQQLNIDVIANNLANVNTSGFKRNRIDFEDLLYRTTAGSRAATGGASRLPQTGMGTAVAASGKIFTAGDVKKTDQPLDIAVRGQGFFEVQLPDGNFAYTRSGAFQISNDGMLMTQDGHQLSASIQVPPDATSVRVEADGKVSAVVPGETRPIDIGQIELVSFINPAGLNPIGDNLYTAGQNSGDALRGFSGQNGAGTLAQGFLEASNVRLIDEMVNLIVAQRAYETNAKVVQASDEMLSISNSLFR
jgi:flagellar basal-body rod protein FlgG